MKNICSLGNSCQPSRELELQIPDYNAKSIFAGLRQNQLLNDVFVPLYLFDYETYYKDFTSPENWIVLKQISSSDKVPIYQQLDTVDRNRQYYEIDHRIKDTLAYDYHDVNYELGWTSWSKNNQQYYNSKLDVMYPHGDMKSLEKFLHDLKTRYEYFVANRYKMFFIYQFDYCLKYRHLRMFEDFLKYNDYDFSNFIYLDVFGENFPNLKIQTMQMDSKKYISENRYFLKWKSNQIS